MIWLILTFILSPLQAIESLNERRDVLQVYVFELKPLIYQDENKIIRGPWYEKFEKLSKKANVTFHYQFVSIPRLELILAGTRPGCNMTLVKTKKRIEKGKINFIHDHEKNTILKAYQRSNDKRIWTIKKIQNDKSLKIITNTGVGIDALEEKDIKSAELLFNINSIIHMLLINRIDLVVGSNLAIEAMDEFKTGKLKESLTIKNVVHGIGCSRATPVEIINKIKKAAKTWSLD